MGAAAIMVVATALVLLNNRKLEKPDADGFKDELQQAAKQVLPKVFLVYTGGIIGYMILIQPLHFLPSSFAFLLVSILISFTFAWDVNNALALMVGVYCGGVYGGSRTAILLNTKLWTCFLKLFQRKNARVTWITLSLRKAFAADHPPMLRIRPPPIFTGKIADKIKFKLMG